MALPTGLMGPDTDRFSKLVPLLFRAHRLRPLRPALRKKSGGTGPLQAEFRVTLQKPGRCLFVFLRGKGTGGIKDPSAGPHHGSRTVQDLVLTGRAHGYLGRAPFQPCILILPEHPFPGAGSVHGDAIKKLPEPRDQARRLHIGDHCISDPHALDVLGQDLCPGRMDLIAHQKPLLFHLSCQMGTLSAWSRTEVQDPFSRPGIQGLGARLGAGLLDIIGPRLMERVLSRPELLRIIKSLPAPGDPLQARKELWQPLSGL